MVEFFQNLWEGAKNIIDGAAGIWQEVINVFSTTVSYLQELIDNINSIQFDTNSPIFIFQGTVRYVMGEPLYALMITFIIILGGLYIWKLVRKVIEVIEGMLPSFKNKIKVM